MTDPWAWMATVRSDRPDRRFLSVDFRRKPVKKASPLQKVLPNMAGLKADCDIDEFLFKHRKKTAVINFGSSWCTHCHEMFPHMIALSKVFSKSLTYAVAQVDFLSAEASKGIDFTPTFAVYRAGRKIDQFYGANAQQLYDHLWLHHE